VRVFRYFCQELYSKQEAAVQEPLRPHPAGRNGEKTRRTRLFARVVFTCAWYTDLHMFYILCWPCISLKILANDKLGGLFRVFIYFISLHVSSVTMLIIRRSNCINT